LVKLPKIKTTTLEQLRSKVVLIAKLLVENGDSVMEYKGLLACAVLAAASLTAPAALADTCVGNCGTSGANGVVTLSPTGNAAYQWVSTDGGVSGAGQISSVGGTTGSQYTTSAFSALAGDPLTFYFNYITSDGAGYADYSWTELLTGTGAHVAWLFTARTQPSGDTSPGFGLPTNDSVLTPATTPIIAGAPAWAPLGGSSGTCYNAGCGYTNWIKSTYTIATAGDYKVAYGVVNWSDTAYQSGLAFDGLAVNGVEVPVGPGVPEPATWALMIAGFGMAGVALRQRRFASNV
jgi:hypothetical protein